MKRAGVFPQDLLVIYKSIVRPTVEYASPVWHTGLTDQQTKEIERIQKRALVIIFSPTSASYKDHLEKAQLTTLKDRRMTACKKLFNIIRSDKNHKLFSLLPTAKENTRNLRHFKSRTVRTRTDRYKNTFIPYCINNF